MLLTGQVHLEAKHEFARPIKNVGIFPSCGHTSFVTLFERLGQCLYPTHSSPELESLLHLVLQHF